MGLSSSIVDACGEVEWGCAECERNLRVDGGTCRKRARQESVALGHRSRPESAAGL